MTVDDEGLELLRQDVSCATVLERLGGWKLDAAESTRRALKYRRGPGEIVIVNHEGRGWWDPCGTDRGDVFDLVQRHDPSLNFGQVRRALRGLLGVAPAFPTALRGPPAPRDRASVADRWSRRPALRRGSRTWRYLTERRGLPRDIVAAAADADTVREGPYASAWFAHRDGAGSLTGIEARGPDYRGFLSGGEKSLFRLKLGAGTPTRLAVSEAPIKVLAFAALEGVREDTLYVGTAGGMGPATIACLNEEMAALSEHAGCQVVAAQDADAHGEWYAARLAEMSEANGIACRRAAPRGFKDWDDVLKARGPAPAARSRRDCDVTASRAREGAKP